jgi:hypothetical protein
MCRAYLPAFERDWLVPLSVLVGERWQLSCAGRAGLLRPDRRKGPMSIAGLPGLAARRAQCRGLSLFYLGHWSANCGLGGANCPARVEDRFVRRCAVTSVSGNAGRGAEAALGYMCITQMCSCRPAAGRTVQARDVTLKAAT